MQALYNKGKENILNGGINLSSDTIKAILVDTADYTVDLAAHDNLDDVAAGARVGTAQTLASKTFTDGVFDAADLVFTSVTGDKPEALILYKDTGTESTSKLIAYLDGRFRVEIAVTPGDNPSSITVEDLPAAIASGAVLTKISGTGDNTITTTGAASAGARSISVSGVTTEPTAGAVYEYTASGFDIPTPNGGNITWTWDSGANKIFAI